MTVAFTSSFLHTMRAKYFATLSVIWFVPLTVFLYWEVKSFCWCVCLKGCSLWWHFVWLTDKAQQGLSKRRLVLSSCPRHVALTILEAHFFSENMFKAAAGAHGFTKRQWGKDSEGITASSSLCVLILKVFAVLHSLVRPLHPLLKSAQ